MPQCEAWLRHQQRRWLRPDGARWVRPDARRFLKPNCDPAEAFPALTFKYNPNQPRVPAGNPDGGQWTSGDGGFSRAPGGASSSTSPMGDIALPNGSHEYPSLFGITPAKPTPSGVRLAGILPEGSDPTQGTSGEQPPEIPSRMPDTREKRMAFVRAAARWIASVGRYAPAVDVFFGAMQQIEDINRLTDMIKTANDPARSLQELQRRVGLETERGYHDHHIVGQFNENMRRFGSEIVDGSANRVRIPVLKHIEISRWYSTKNNKMGGKTPRDYLRDKSWDEQMAIGLDTLRKFGVLE